MDGDGFEADRHRTFATCGGVFIATVSQLDQGKNTVTTGHCEKTTFIVSIGECTV